jgi:2-succinyl-5-enolpyruvyl-6-hydroxy-3-cyclohexene-1-carboxylate synthase
MPVRDLEWYAPAQSRPPVVLANRGANGIDGVLSTALGVAASRQGPVVALLGDLAFLHDVSALVRPARAAPACTVVVADNGGGGMFSFLPQATSVDADTFDALFATPQAVDVAAVARGFGVAVTEVDDLSSLDKQLRRSIGGDTLSLIRVVLPDRVTNAAYHAEIHRAVAVAMDEVLSPARPVSG